MKINKVTITGADDAVNIADLLSLTNDYPFVEWGILFSMNKMGEERYPNADWIEKASNKLSNLSAHFCGWFAKEILERQGFDAIRELEGFNRIQLNYNFKNGVNWSLHDLVKFMEGWERNIILQYNKSNASYLNAIHFPKNIHFLYDSSGGRGTPIANIANPFSNNYTGYAGGISDVNILDIKNLIEQHKSEVDVWIDMESGVRTNNQFDLKKVEKVLKVLSIS